MLSDFNIIYFDGYVDSGSLLLSTNSAFSVNIGFCERYRIYPNSNNWGGGEISIEENTCITL